MGNHSERWGPTMKTLLLLLLALACAMPMPQGSNPNEGKDSSEEDSDESNETSEDLQELESNEDFVVTSSCFVEAMDGDGNLDEQTLEKCVQCFEEADALGEGEDAVRLPRFAPLSTCPTSMRIARMALSRQLSPKLRFWNASWTLLRCSIKPARFERE